MKYLLSCCAFLFIMAVFSCKKTTSNPGANLSLMQHKWILVSQNGEALRYAGEPGDYYNFATDNFLYLYVNKIYDTMAYVLLPDKKTLSFYLVLNGSRSVLATNYDIKVLDSNHFVISTGFSTVNTLDSLKR